MHILHARCKSEKYMHIAMNISISLVKFLFSASIKRESFQQLHHKNTTKNDRYGTRSCGLLNHSFIFTCTTASATAYSFMKYSVVFILREDEIFAKLLNILIEINFNTINLFVVDLSVGCSNRVNISYNCSSSQVLHSFPIN